MSNDQDAKQYMVKDEHGQLRVPCEIYQRVMGYHRPVTSWNIGKQQEHKDRKYFDYPKHLM